MNDFYWRRIVSPSPTHSIVASKVADVTGDGFPDWVYLTAVKQPDSPYLTNITLVIRNGRTHQSETYSLTENSGYYPTLWLGDFTGNGINDILIVIDSGGSGGVVYAYIYSTLQDRMTKIFDSIQFNEQHQYQVQYANQYKVNIISDNPRKIYTLDLHYKGPEYLNEIYNPDGTLKQPIEGWVDPVGGIYPIDLSRNNKYYLLIMQQIAGRYHADGLGYVENLLSWNGHQFEIVRQTVATYGKNID
ncbi:VCBS repeat-containing protein [Lysinibacillus telephonicus]|uniref:VCBS repeat-containing protein n=1 Tax=Lysinibacillus telephonicus TaxID=1714840 RepID=UPI0031FD9D72